MNESNQKSEETQSENVIIAMQRFQNENSHLKENLENIQQQAQEMLYERDVQIHNLKTEIDAIKQNIEENKEETLLTKHSENENFEIQINDLNCIIKDLKDKLLSDSVESTKLNSELESLRITYENLKQEHDENRFVSAEFTLLKQSCAIFEEQNNYYKVNFEFIQTQANQMLYERDVKIIELTTFAQ